LALAARPAISKRLATWTITLARLSFGPDEPAGGEIVLWEQLVRANTKSAVMRLGIHRLPSIVLEKLSEKLLRLVLAGL
jgi:hypothetical protein